MHYVEGSLMAILVMKYVLNIICMQSPWIIKQIVSGIFKKVDDIFLGPTLQSHIDFLEAELGKRRWLAGDDFSGADVQVIIIS